MKHMKLNIAAVMLVGAISMGAEADTNTVTIRLVGCDQNSSCFANITPPTTNSAGCSNPNQIRWDGSTTAGKNFTAVAITAKAASINAVVGTLNSGCSGSFPTVNFMSIE